MKKFRKLISLMLIIAMTITCLPVVSIAAEESSVEHLTEVPEGYIGIYTKDDLYAIRENPMEKYILMNDIVFTDEDYTRGGDFYNSGAGWEPIGTKKTPFNGIFDGNGYTIYDLYVNAPDEEYQGLFGYTYLSTICNINLAKSEITGNNYVGGIVGYAYISNIFNDNFDGSVFGNNHIGGICGRLYGYEGYASDIINCIVKGSVCGNTQVGGVCGSWDCATPSIIKNCVNCASVLGNENVGGIVGNASPRNEHETDYNNYIEKCCNVSSVEAKESSAGGIVGYSKGRYKESSYYPYTRYYGYVFINNCINIGDIVAPVYAGGLIGEVCEYTCAKYSYSIGKVLSDKNFGGCFGLTPTTVTFCYYLDEAVVNPTSTAGMAKSTDQLEKKGTFEQWDFNTVWTMEGREDYPYPELRDVPLVFPEDYKEEIKGEISIVGDTTVGSTLTVDTSKLENENSDITIEWVIGGEVVGTGDSYTLTEDDAGKEITVNIKGDGDFKGTISSTIIVDCAEHSFTSYVSNNDATCKADGTKTAKCDNCNATDTIADEGSKKGHSYTSEVTKEATHLEEGETTYTCECGDSYTEAIAKLEGHSYTSEVTKEATHLEEGETTYTCECGDSYTEAIAKLEGHTYKSVVTAPTCTSKGYTTYTCECGDTYIADYVDEAEHSFTNYISNNDATCTADGTKTAKCNNCDAKETVVDKGSAKGHSYNLTLTPATCDKEGSKVYTCECGNRYSEVIPALGHKDDNRDGYCDDCREDIDGFVDENECLCICHEEGAGSILYKILLFIQRYFKVNLLKKVFKMNRICECGVNHY